MKKCSCCESLSDISVLGIELCKTCAKVAIGEIRTKLIEVEINSYFTLGMTFQSMGDKFKNELIENIKRI